MKRYLCTTLLLLSVLTGFSFAQSRGSYFFENALLRGKLNPAFAPKTDYATFSFIGSLSVDAASNVGLRNFVVPDGDKNYLFLNDNVSSETFLEKMLPSKDPYLRERIESDLFGVGMKIGQDGYATASLSVVEAGSLVLTNELLRFAKTGDAGVQDYFSGGSVQLAGYAALSLGYSHDLHFLVGGLRAGVRIKLLSGLAAANFAIDQMSMQLGETMLSAGVHGSGALSGIGYDADHGFSFSGISLRNIGAAVDLGASYRFQPGGRWVNSVVVSASVSDLGAIRYKKGVTALSLNQRFSFSGISDFSEDMQAQFEQLFKDVEGLARIDASEGEPFTYVLSPSIHAGAAAYFLEEKANAGLLYYHAVGRSNLMASCGYSPLDWLNVGVNWTFLGPASRLGFYVELIPKKYVEAFFGMERASWRRSGNHIPVRNCTDSFSVGLNILFGN